MPSLPTPPESLHERYLESNLWIAAADNDKEAVEYFLSFGGPNHTPMDINEKDDYDYTALHAATSYQHASMIEFLISKGANVNITDCDGDSPLHIAETVACAKVLLEHGADPHMKNSADLIPIQVMDQQGYDELVEFMKPLTPDYEPCSREEEDDEDFPYQEVLEEVMAMHRQTHEEPQR